MSQQLMLVRDKLIDMEFNLQKISTCVLENVSVSYGGDRFRTFTPNDEGAPPVETQITLNFAELELITKERVFEGY